MLNRGVGGNAGSLGVEINTGVTNKTRHIVNSYLLAIIQFRDVTPTNVISATYLGLFVNMQLVLVFTKPLSKCLDFCCVELWHRVDNKVPQLHTTKV